MKRWRGTVVVSYVQQIEIDAETQAEAEASMCDMFDEKKAYASEWQAYDVEEVKPEGEMK